MPEVLTPPAVSPAPLEERKPDPLAVAVAQAVAALRRDAGLSERAGAKRLGTSQTQLRRMEDPRYLPSLRSLARVASAYGYRLTVEFVAPSAPPPVKPVKPVKAAAPARGRPRPRPDKAKVSTRAKSKRTSKRARARR